MYDLPVGKGRKFLNHGGVINAVLGGWNVVWVETAQSGPAVTFSFAGSPNKYLPGPSRPNQLADPKVPNWSMGTNRFPQGAQNPLYNIGAFAYPAQFTSGTLGGGTSTGLWLIWPQWSLSKSYRLKERYKFSVRLDANNIPVRLMATTPDTAVNITSPACGSFAIEAKAQSFKQIDGVLSLPAARIRGDIDTPAGYLLQSR